MRRGHALAGLALLAASCVPEVAVLPATLQPPSGPPARYVVAMPAAGVSSAGYPSVLPPGTVLEEVGTIPSGRVLHPVNIVLTAQGANIAQADAVVSGNLWIGFYLTVQHGFSPLRAAVPLMLEQRP